MLISALAIYRIASAYISTEIHNHEPSGAAPRDTLIPERRLCSVVTETSGAEDGMRWQDYVYAAGIGTVRFADRLRRSSRP